jgi:hypothetical protein
MFWMFTDVSEECPASIFITYDDGYVGKRLKNHIPEDYLKDKGKKQPLRSQVVVSLPPRTGERRGS